METLWTLIFDNLLTFRPEAQREFANALRGLEWTTLREYIAKLLPDHAREVIADYARLIIQHAQAEKRRRLKLAQFHRAGAGTIAALLGIQRQQSWRLRVRVQRKGTLRIIRALAPPVTAAPPAPADTGAWDIDTFLADEIQKLGRAAEAGAA